MTRILVCGGRDYSDRGRFFSVLDRAVERLGPVLILEGGATGADALAREWAAERGAESRTFKADWRRFGRSAGPTRNSRMLTEGCPDFVVAFPGGTGTADMVRKARAAGVRVVLVDPDGP